MLNFRSQNNKHGWFWNLFTKKSRPDYSPQKPKTCRVCSKKSQVEKRDGFVQTDDLPVVKDEKSIVPYDDSAVEPNIQHCTDCSEKKDRRGCGFHFYFSIDNSNKPELMRNKRIAKYQTSKCGECMRTNEVKKVTSKGTCKCINNVNDSAKISHSVQKQQHVCRQCMSKHKSLHVGHKKSNWSTTNAVESVTEPNNNSGKSVQTKSDEAERHSKIRFISVEKPEDSQIKAHKTESDPKALKKVESHEEAIFKEYEGIRKSIRRRSSLKNRNTMVRNSLISLRRGKTIDRGSVDEFLFSQILSKLNNIEGKIAELEKIGEDRDKNIKNIVGISCNNARSKMSVDVNNRGNNGVEIDKVESSDTIGYKANERVSITFRGGDISIKRPENGMHNKKARPKEGKEQLAYHNIQELDAHNIPFTLKRHATSNRINDGEKNTNIDENTNTPSNQSEKHVPMIWTKISEELKS